MSKVEKKKIKKQSHQESTGKSEENKFDLKKRITEVAKKQERNQYDLSKLTQCIRIFYRQMKNANILSKVTQADTKVMNQALKLNQDSPANDNEEAQHSNTDEVEISRAQPSIPDPSNQSSTSDPPNQQLMPNPQLQPNSHNNEKQREKSLQGQQNQPQQIVQKSNSSESNPQQQPEKTQNSNMEAPSKQSKQIPVEQVSKTSKEIHTSEQFELLTAREQLDKANILLRDLQTQLKIATKLNRYFDQELRQINEVQLDISKISNILAQSQVQSKELDQGIHRKIRDHKKNQNSSSQEGESMMGESLKNKTLEIELIAVSQFKGEMLKSCDLMLEQLVTLRFDRKLEKVSKLDEISWQIFQSFSVRYKKEFQTHYYTLQTNEYSVVFTLEKEYPIKNLDTFQEKKRLIQHIPKEAKKIEMIKVFRISEPDKQTSSCSSQKNPV